MVAPSMVPAHVHLTLGLTAQPGARQGRETRSPRTCLHIDPDAARFYLTKKFSSKNLYCSAQSPS